MEFLCPYLQSRLAAQGIKALFPVQETVIPEVLAAFSSHTLSDVCVCSPTGSGKTMAYALPIIQALLESATRQVRCLVVLPTRDLGAQVFDVFTSFIEGTPIKAAMVTGQKDFHAEQAMLVQCHEDLDGFPQWTPKVDIVVCTPGRILDHLSKTKGFTLQHCRFLVVDEADILLGENYQDWTQYVLKALPSSHTLPSYQQPNPLGLQLGPGALKLPSLSQFKIHKMLFSATLTQKLSKLAELQLANAKYFAMGTLEGGQGPQYRQLKRYTLPVTLEEKTVSVTVPMKPIILVALVLILMEMTEEPSEAEEEQQTRYRTLLDRATRQRKRQSILVFTNSVKVGHKVARVMELYGLHGVREFSSALHQSERSKVIAGMRKGDVSVIVCTDAMARGMDLPTVNHVVNYDPPTYVENYVHRVGRTARAGKRGTAFTFLAKDEEQPFKELHRQVETAAAPEPYVISSVDIESTEQKFPTVLGELGQLLEKERNGRLDASLPLTRGTLSKVQEGTVFWQGSADDLVHLSESDDEAEPAPKRQRMDGDPLLDGEDGMQTSFGDGGDVMQTGKGKGKGKGKDWNRDAAHAGKGNGVQPNRRVQRNSGSANFKRGSATIKVQRVPAGCSEEILAEAFQRFGEVQSAAVKAEGSPAYGYVNFTTVEAAQAATNCSTIEVMGVTCTVGLAKRRKGQVVEAPPSNGIGLFNLPYSTTQDELQNLLSPYAGFKTLKMVHKKTGEFRGYIFAYFESVETATVAKEMLTGLIMGDQQVDVKFSSQSSEEAVTADDAVPSCD
uniref:ATP-dependent RNA helicase n=1 Tax=Eutreptiella gymnastica TaxID=73025 RepID=A0A7S1IFS1_9EUGL|mmetsp:Transcript_15507/g.27490  ORF Transcript_15507/g.27490 Transcript_15507/m.27490 type:complete len:786 (+) Transcript_15507:62-2419(+)